MSAQAPTPATLAHLKDLERQVLWHACWMIHNANHLRENLDGLKVARINHDRALLPRPAA